MPPRPPTSPHLFYKGNNEIVSEEKLAAHLRNNSPRDSRSSLCGSQRASFNPPKSVARGTAMSDQGEALHDANAKHRIIQREALTAESQLPRRRRRPLLCNSRALDFVHPAHARARPTTCLYSTGKFIRYNEISSLR